MMLYLRHKITTNVQHWQIFRAKDALRARVRGHFGAARGCRVVLPWASRGPVAGGAGGELAAWVVAPFRLPRNALCHSCFSARVWGGLAKRPPLACQTGLAAACNGACCLALRRGGPRAPPCAAVPAAIRWGRGHRVQVLRRLRSVVFATFLQPDANFSRKSFGVSEKVITFAPAYKKHGRLAQLV